MLIILIRRNGVFVIISGGGRSSAWETAARAAAGAIAKLFLHQHEVHLHGFVSQVGDIVFNPNYESLDLSAIESTLSGVRIQSWQKNDWAD